MHFAHSNCIYPSRMIYLEIVPASFSSVFVVWLNECCVAVVTTLASRTTVSQVVLVCEACAF